MNTLADEYSDMNADELGKPDFDLIARALKLMEDKMPTSAQRRSGNYEVGTIYDAVRAESLRARFARAHTAIIYHEEDEG